jgi:AraC family transcriptional regulator
MNNYKIIDNVMQHLESNLKHNISMNDLLTKFNYSTTHLYRLVTAVVGVSPIKYYKQRRLSEAARMIVESDLPITHICFEYGFENQEVFSRAIKKEFGVSATELRKVKTFKYYQRFERMNEKRSQHMKCEIVNLEKFELYGVEQQLNQQEQVDHGIINKLLKDYLKELTEDNLVYSVYEYDVEDLDQEDSEINYKYFIGTRSGKGQLKEISHSKYAKFTYDVNKKTINGQVLSDFVLDGEPVEDVYDYIDGVWLPNSSFELSSNHDFEVRDRKNKSVIEYYISIK